MVVSLWSGWASRRDFGTERRRVVCLYVCVWGFGWIVWLTSVCLHRDRKNQIGEASCRICLEKFSTPIDCKSLLANVYIAVLGLWKRQK